MKNIKRVKWVLSFLHNALHRQQAEAATAKTTDGLSTEPQEAPINAMTKLKQYSLAV